MGVEHDQKYIMQSSFWLLCGSQMLGGEHEKLGVGLDLKGC